MPFSRCARAYVIWTVNRLSLRLRSLTDFVTRLRSLTDFVTRLPSLADSCHSTPFTHSLTAVTCHHSTPSTRSDCRHVDSGCQLLAALLTQSSTVSFTVCVNPFSHPCPVRFESTFYFETHLVVTCKVAARAASKATFFFSGSA